MKGHTATPLTGKRSNRTLSMIKYWLRGLIELQWHPIETLRRSLGGWRNCFQLRSTGCRSNRQTANRHDGRRLSGLQNVIMQEVLLGRVG